MKQKSMEIPITECSFIPANTGNEFPKVDVIFDNVCAFLHSEFVKHFLGITDRVMWTEIIL